MVLSWALSEVILDTWQETASHHSINSLYWTVSLWLFSAFQSGWVRFRFYLTAGLCDLWIIFNLLRISPHVFTEQMWTHSALMLNKRELLWNLKHQHLVSRFYLKVFIWTEYSIYNVINPNMSSSAPYTRTHWLGKAACVGASWVSVDLAFTLVLGTAMILKKGRRAKNSMFEAAAKAWINKLQYISDAVAATGTGLLRASTAFCLHSFISKRKELCFYVGLTLHGFWSWYMHGVSALVYAARSFVFCSRRKVCSHLWWVT